MLCGIFTFIISKKPKTIQRPIPSRPEIENRIENVQNSQIIAIRHGLSDLNVLMHNIRENKSLTKDEIEKMMFDLKFADPHLHE